MFKNRKFRCLTAVGLIILAGALVLVASCQAAPKTTTASPTTGQPEAKVYQLRVQTYVGAAEMNEQLIPWWEVPTEEASGGRLDMTLFAGGSPVPAEEIIIAVGEGVVDMGLSTGVYWDDLMPVCDLELGMPFSYRTPEELTYFFYDKGLNDILRDAYAEHNVYFVGPIGPMGKYSLMSSKPVNSMADMQKMVIRATGPVANLLSKVDVNTTYIPGAELYTALATGTVDGCVWAGPSDYYLTKFYEAAKYLMEPPFVSPVQGYAIIVNMDLWEELPDDLKAILNMSAMSTITSFAKHFEVLQNIRQTLMVDEEGVTVTSLPDEDVAELQEAAILVWDELAQKEPKYAGPAIQLLKDFMKELGYMD